MEHFGARTVAIAHGNFCYFLTMNYCLVERPSGYLLPCLGTQVEVLGWREVSRSADHQVSCLWFVWKKYSSLTLLWLVPDTAYHKTYRKHGQWKQIFLFIGISIFFCSGYNLRVFFWRGYLLSHLPLRRWVTTKIIHCYSCITYSQLQLRFHHNRQSTTHSLNLFLSFSCFFGGLVIF